MKWHYMGYQQDHFYYFNHEFLLKLLCFRDLITKKQLHIFAKFIISPMNDKIGRKER